MRQKKTHVFFDTEFIGFNRLDPLSLAFVPNTKSLAPAYFERELDQLDFTGLSYGDREFLEQNVLCQLDNKQAFADLFARGVQTNRTNFKTLKRIVSDYLELMVRSVNGEGLLLVSDSQKDFLVLRRFVSQEKIDQLWLNEVFISSLIPDDRLRKEAFVERQEALFNNPAEFSISGEFSRHHAYFDAWVMKEAFLHAKR